MSTVYVCPERDIECGQRAANWCASCPQRRASPAAAVPEDALPPLPEPDVTTLRNGAYFTTEQMQAYARAAVEADRARQTGSLTVEVRNGRVYLVRGVQSFMLAYNTDEQSELAWYANQLRAALADRAQQGETVACPCPNLEIEHDNDTGGAFCKGNCPSAATKAAAPDAPTDELINLIVAYGAACTCMNVTASRDLMAEIKGKLSGAAPVPDTGIPTAGEVAELLRVGAMMANTMFNLAQRAGDVIDSDLAAKFDKMRKEWDAARRAPVSSTPTAGAVEGWKWVPAKPTAEMLKAGAESEDRHFGLIIHNCYCAMVDAAPQPPEAKAGDQS